MTLLRSLSKQKSDPSLVGSAARLGASGQMEPFGSDAEIFRQRTVAHARDDPLRGVVWLHFHFSMRGSVMDRRRFIGGVMGGFLALPPAARAQQPAMALIGFLCSASSQQWTRYVAGF